MLMLLTKFFTNISPLEVAVMASIFFNQDAKFANANKVHFWRTTENVQIRYQRGAGTKMHKCLVGLVDETVKLIAVRCQKVQISIQWTHLTVGLCILYLHI